LVFSLNDSFRVHDRIMSDMRTIQDGIDKLKLEAQLRGLPPPSVASDAMRKEMGDALLNAITAMTSRLDHISGATAKGEQGNENPLER
jgi:hypothetical protein